jgi:hypothetical protein
VGDNLRETYLSGTNFLQNTFFCPEMDAEFDFYAFLSKEEGIENGFEGPNQEIYPSTNIEEMLEEFQKAQIFPPTSTAIPFGGDACPNFFCRRRKPFSNCLVL